MGSKAKQRPPSPGPDSARPTVYLTGDHALVFEYARLCLGKGYAVVCHAHDGDLAVSLAGEEHVRVSTSVPRSASVGMELSNVDRVRKQENLRRLDQALESDRLILSTSLIVSATEQSTWIDHPYRLIGFGALPSFSERRSVEVAPTVSSPVETMEVARRFFSTLGMDLEIVQDRVGMVFPRLLCHVVNEAAFAIQEGSASPADVDRAAVLGAGFPRGPLEWAAAIGFPQILAVLTALYADLHEERYRVCPLLKQFALGARRWHTTSSTPETES
jgi:3-hydroxybutyryl-CoA dehydrogenase